ncbi:hypothetical protein ACLI1A_14415 [Flavobacterium sp. RHBU_3]|uniref:hypothetical protein n=1 Tax=Flavobacterium sp. RHBU_3 TaxID=3391184 RepID=UPI0039851AB3
MKDKLRKLLTGTNIIVSFLIFNIIAYISYGVQIGDLNDPLGKAVMATGHLLCFTATLLYFLKNRDMFK